MEELFGKHIRSPIFTFQVGHEKEAVMVHAGPLADLSPALYALINIEMKEAKLRRVNWPDVSKDTFTRLCEFAYLHDYTPPTFQQATDFDVSTKSPQPVPESEPEPEPEPEPAYEPEHEPGPNHEFWDGWEGWTAHQRRKKEKEAIKKGIPPLMEDIYAEPELFVSELPFRERTICDGNLHNVFSALDYTLARNAYQFTPTSNRGPTQDFTPVFLGHAELYVVADKYGIESLRNLVLYKLHQTLKDFTIYETDMVSIIDFIRFTYQNTRSETGEIDPLRNLATRYVASILGQVGDREDFGQLLAAGGDFVVDFWRIIRKAS